MKSLLMNYWKQLKQLNNMIITVKDIIEREIEINFPCSFKSGSTYAHFNSKESYGVVVREQINDISTCNIAHLNNLGEYTPCEKSEVEAAFNRVIKHYKANVFGITVDLNSNTSTDDLEQLNKDLENETHRQGCLYGN